MTQTDHSCFSTTLYDPSGKSEKKQWHNVTEEYKMFTQKSNDVI